MGETGPSDKIVLVNARDEPIAAVAREELRRRRRPHFRTTHVHIFDPRSRLLLQRLAARRDRNAMRWGSSVAAYVREGESYAETAVRRSREELGLAVDLDLVGKTEMPDLGGVKHIALFASGVSTDAVQIRERDHVDEIAWFTVAEVTTMTRERPEEFTETFLWLFDRFYSDGQLRRASNA